MLRIAINKVSSFILGVKSTPDARAVNRHNEIESCANYISLRIAGCKSMRDCYDACDMVFEFKAVYGDSAQVNGWFHSLLLALWNRENEILAKL